MKTEIVITIKLPLFKRWILKALIGGLLKNLDESQKFYRDGEEYNGEETRGGEMYGNQKQGIEQSINTVRLYCGMRERNFRTEEYVDNIKTDD